MRKSATIIAFVIMMFLPSFAQEIGRVEQHDFFSPILDVTKGYYVYLPAGYDTSAAHYPSVYFLSLHESAWFNRYFYGRNGKALQDVADSLIANGHIGKMILVSPSMGSNDAFVFGEVNMLRPDLTDSLGIGTGLFEDYLVQDIITHIDSTFRTIPDRAHRGIDGFSLGGGGYTSTVISFRNPAVFSSVGSYDGTIMWHNLDDPSIPGTDPDDDTWLNPLYDPRVAPLFDSPRNIEYMLLHSASNIIELADSVTIDSIREMRFHITTTPNDMVGNMGRNTQLLNYMASRGIYNTFEDSVLAPDAVHHFGFADLHASKSLIKHWETFQQTASIEDNSFPIPKFAELYQNYPNPFNSLTAISYSLAKPSHVLLEIYNILGQRVEVIVDETQEAGGNSLTWQAGDVPSGVYFYRIIAGDYEDTRKMILLK
jgi:S-formylglutathione hydrolase FrmB